MNHATNEDGKVLYAILRRSVWRSTAELQRSCARSMEDCDGELSDEVRWIRSYVLDELDGTLGTVSIYEATSPEAVRAHAAHAQLPLDEIIRVADTVVARPDPLEVKLHAGAPAAPYRRVGHNSHSRHPPLPTPSTSHAPT